MTIEESYSESRRRFLQASVALGSAIALAPRIIGEVFAASNDKSESAVVDRGERSGLVFNRNDTAVVFIDPQNEVLSEKGGAWGAVGDSVKENQTVENMERIFKAAKHDGYEVFIFPHYFYPTDKGWKFNGPLDTEELKTNMFARRGALSLDGFAGSGADWLARFKPYIEDGKTITVSPTGSGVRRPMISSCNCASVASVRSFSAGCWRTCVSNLTCAICSSRVSRSSS